MSQNITKRLAARGLDMEKIPLQRLFKIVEGILERKPLGVSTHTTKSGSSYCVIEFEDKADAGRIYEFCEGLQIEDTKEIFDLSFIPDAMDVGPAAEECRTSAGYRFKRGAEKEIDYEDMIESSSAAADAEPATAEAPAEPAESERSKKKRLEKEAREKKAAEVKEMLDDQEKPNELEGFQFDIADERFKKVFEDADYTIDASHKKYKKRPEAAEIMAEVRKRHEH
ncbi:hypothetical protein PAPHI01_1204 [Pancytospora philotis]|nr:hypothetical protein PAPHI01_1204 [Pancytospora philotis]